MIQYITVWFHWTSLHKADTNSALGSKSQNKRGWGPPILVKTLCRLLRNPPCYCHVCWQTLYVICRSDWRCFAHVRVGRSCTFPQAWTTCFAKSQSPATATQDHGQQSHARRATRWLSTFHASAASQSLLYVTDSSERLAFLSYPGLEDEITCIKYLEPALLIRRYCSSLVSMR